MTSHVLSSLEIDLIIVELKSTGIDFISNCNIIVFSVVICHSLRYLVICGAITMWVHITELSNKSNGIKETSNPSNPPFTWINRIVNRFPWNWNKLAWVGSILWLYLQQLWICLKTNHIPKTGPVVDRFEQLWGNSDRMRDSRALKKRCENKARFL